MKKLAMIIAPAVLAAGVCGMLRADDSNPIVPDPARLAYYAHWQEENVYLWGLQRTAEIAKDPEMSGVQAVLEADEFMKATKEPQVEIDFFNKALYDAKSPAVRREARMMLYKLYRQQGQADKALEQLEELMTEEP
jgi:hypothetical protein